MRQFLVGLAAMDAGSSDAVDVDICCRAVVYQFGDAESSHLASHHVFPSIAATNNDILVSTSILFNGKRYRLQCRSDDGHNLN
jgi:hypothetical protein